MPPGQAYAEGVAAGRWSDDPAQRAVLGELDRIWHALTEAPAPGLLGRLLGRAPRGVTGLYLWGGVGRGKTFLTELFLEHLPATVGRRRVHFHRFMGEVHARLRALGERSDPLDVVAAELAQQLRVLVLDEFVVNDIGDAMLLARLLDGLFERGVCLVATSNTVPAELYRDGLQRARFLPAIAALERHCRVVEMVSNTDYRLRTLTRARVYHVPLDDAAEAALRDCFDALTADLPAESAALLLHGRRLQPRGRADGVVWFDFATLCEGPRAVADYIELARDFHTVLLSGVPLFDGRNDDPARRFVHLVDEFYDRNVNLVLSAAAPPLALYTGQRVAREFERTVSRLIEMQSEAYLAAPHRP